MWLHQVDQQLKVINRTILDKYFPIILSEISHFLRRVTDGSNLTAGGYKCLALHVGIIYLSPTIMWLKINSTAKIGRFFLVTYVTLAHGLLLTPHREVHLITLLSHTDNAVPLC